MVRERWRDQSRRVANGCRWVKQRQPRRVGLSGRIAVGVGLADCCDGPPELIVVLIIPAYDQRVSRSHVLHREETGTVDDAQILAGSEAAKHPVPQRKSMVLPENRRVSLVRRSQNARE